MGTPEKTDITLNACVVNNGDSFLMIKTRWVSVSKNGDIKLIWTKLWKRYIVESRFLKPSVSRRNLPISRKNFRFSWIVLLCSFTRFLATLFVFPGNSKNRDSTVNAYMFISDYRFLQPQHFIYDTRDQVRKSGEKKVIKHVQNCLNAIIKDRFYLFRRDRTFL